MPIPAIKAFYHRLALHKAGSGFAPKKGQPIFPPRPKIG
jgi:hypothetical protein